jgi:hypothetical protein
MGFEPTMSYGFDNAAGLYKAFLDAAEKRSLH